MIRKLKEDEVFYSYGYYSGILMSFSFCENVFQVFVDINNFLHNDNGPAETTRGGLNYWAWKGHWIK